MAGFDRDIAPPGYRPGPRRPWRRRFLATRTGQALLALLVVLPTDGGLCWLGFILHHPETALGCAVVALPISIIAAVVGLAEVQYRRRLHEQLADLEQTNLTLLSWMQGEPP